MEYIFDIQQKVDMSYSEWQYSDFKVIQAGNGLEAEEKARNYVKSMGENQNTTTGISIEYRVVNLRSL